MFILDLFWRKPEEKISIELNDFLEDNIKKKDKPEEVKEYEPEELKEDEPEEVNEVVNKIVNEVVKEEVNEVVKEEVNDIDLKITKKDEDAMCYTFQERVLYYIAHPIYFFKMLFESVVQLKWKL